MGMIFFFWGGGLKNRDDCYHRGTMERLTTHTHTRRRHWSSNLIPSLSLMVSGQSVFKISWRGMRFGACRHLLSHSVRAQVTMDTLLPRRRCGRSSFYWESPPFFVFCFWLFFLFPPFYYLRYTNECGDVYFDFSSTWFLRVSLLSVCLSRKKETSSLNLEKHNSHRVVVVVVVREYVWTMTWIVTTSSLQR